MRVGLPAIAVCAVLGLVRSAQGGVTVSLEGDKDRSVVYIEGNKMRIESRRGDRQESTIIFDGDQQKMTVIEPEKKTYSEMTPETFKGMRRKMEESMSPEQRKQLDQMMSQMTPEQRKAMGGAMGGRPPGGGDTSPKHADIKWERTGSKQTVAGHPCEGFKELRDGELEAEGCYIPWSAGAMTKDDLKPLRKLEEFLAQMGTPFPRGKLGSFAQLEQGPGFPGKWVQLSGGERRDPQTMTSIKRGSVSADKFQPPAGYTKADHPGATN